jgi:hypothetical protein
MGKNANINLPKHIFVLYVKRWKKCKKANEMTATAINSCYQVTAKRLHQFITHVN